MRRIITALFCLFFYQGIAQPGAPKKLPAKRTTAIIKIDGLLNDSAWQHAPAATGFTEFRPTPFRPEDHALRTVVYMLYDDEGIYLSGYCHERTKDSIAVEVNGRDGFGNNDFIGFVFDTYNDKINAFEYFVTPNGEQMDARMTNNGEDFSWNAVWKSAAKIHNDGWTFEIFIPFSAIRFSKKNLQDWGMNITRRRQKTMQQYAWNPIDPNINGFLPQEGYWTGLENIRPPLRLQFSPYFSYYINHYPHNTNGVNNWTSVVSGGMDVKYGINQAITLDMTLIPDFGQVQSDNRILNLSPFEVRYNENRPFFTEGTELFNKGNYFYSRRVGGQPMHMWRVNDQLLPGEHIVKNPTETRLLNATKISGRLQNGLGIGFFNAVQQQQFATIEDDKGNRRKFQTSPLTNYNIIVLDQSLKNNSSISFVNTSVLRSGHDYDATVTAGLFNLFDKNNTWNVGGKLAVSNLNNFLPGGKTLTGINSNAYFGKASGRFTFSISQDLTDDKFNSNDLGYFTNNNFLEHNLRMGYRFTQPSSWYNNLFLNLSVFTSHRYKPRDFQAANYNFNINGQLKNLWQAGVSIGYEPEGNNFYEPRMPGRVFRSWSNWYSNSWISTNAARKYSASFQYLFVDRHLYKGKRHTLDLSQTFRFNQKLAVSHSIMFEPQTNNIGFAAIDAAGNVIFGRRDVHTVSNSFNIKFSINNMMVFNIRTRHYWSRVHYLEPLLLLPDGRVKNHAAFPAPVNMNFNDFLVDASFNWQFAPGSFINIMWKNNAQNHMVTAYGSHRGDGYFRNLNHTLAEPQNNNFSARIIYFLDYLEVKKKLIKT